MSVQKFFSFIIKLTINLKLSTFQKINVLKGSCAVKKNLRHELHWIEMTPQAQYCAKA